MTVNFYYCGDDPATLTKTKKFIKTHDCKIKENSSLLNPTIIIRASEWKKMNEDNEDNEDNVVNYCQIADVSFGNRYYFISNPVITTGDRIEIDLSVDVLESNRLELLECEAYIQRIGSSSQWNKYLPDPIIPIKTTTRVENIQFNLTPFNVINVNAQDSFNHFNYIITVVGGEDNESE